MEFNPKHNIKAVKGFALAHFKDSFGTNVNPKSLTVHSMGEPLKDAVKLVQLECGNSPLIVEHRHH